MAQAGVVVATAVLMGAIAAPRGVARAQTPAVPSSSGEDVFRQSCASCHTGAPDSRAPSLDALRSRTPQAVIESLVTGAMRTQGARLSGPDRRAVAEFVTGKKIEGDVRGAAVGRCSAFAGLTIRRGVVIATPIDRLPSWSSWSPTPTNTRFQPQAKAGLTAADLPRLKLKWSFGYPDASVAWGQPTVIGSRLYVGSQNGTVYALDTQSGCVQWTFDAAGGVRTALAVDWPLLFLGDTGANVYAVDAYSGKQVWRKKVEEHAFARITGSPTLHGGRLYVPLSSYEESQGADPQYPCCTFRGSVVALDAKTGAVIWKTYMIPETPQRRGKSSAGVDLWGPAGSAIWSAPTVDVERRALYVATGNSYSGAHPSSDAVVALDLAAGTIRWMRQVTPNDVYISGCRSGNPNCPEANGPDLDFGSPPMLVSVRPSTPLGADRGAVSPSTAAKTMLVIGQKSGIAFAMDPDRRGEVIWQYRAGQGGLLGGIEWGGAADSEHAYFAVSDITTSQPGGLHAVSLATGERAWFAPPAKPACAGARGCNAAQSAAVTAIPGVVFSGSSDGSLRAYSTRDGAIIWEFDSNRDFTTVNGVAARGASMIGPGPVVAGGMIFVNSGYGAFGGRPGNVLLAFGVEK